MDDDPYGFKDIRECLDPNLTPEEYEFHEQCIKNTIICATQDIGTQHVLGAPMIDILSVRLRLKLPNLPHKPPWRIFGDIDLRQEPGPHLDVTKPIKLPFFRRTVHDSQPLYPSFPFLDLHLGHPISTFFPSVDLSLDLCAKLPKDPRRKPLITKVLTLDYTDSPDNMFDRVIQHNFETDNAFVYVKCITYRAACLATVNFTLDVPTGLQSRQLSVSGKIYASWHHNKEDFEHHREHDDHCTCVCLFNSFGTKVTTGQPFQLIRPTIGVPAYATLVLEFILTVQGVDDYHLVDFTVSDIDISTMEFEVPGGLVGRVKMQWANQYFYDSDEEEAEKEEETNPKLTLPQVPKPICIYDTILGVTLIGKQMMEIFSVYVELNDKRNTCRLNGTIDVKDAFGSHRIFEINDPNLTKKISHGTTLPLVGSEECLQGPCFLQVNLKDDKGQEFCRGYVGWSIPLLRDPWLNKWLLSVIKGKLGFAVISYALFTPGVSCAVTVFLSAPSSCENVHMRGSIFSQYDTDYPTTFDKKYYRSGLFQKGDEREPMLLEFAAQRQLIDIPIPTSSRSKEVMPNKYWVSVPLTKSAVCVPEGNTLLIDIDLSVECETVERLMGCVEFEIGHETWHVIKSNKYQLSVSVGWS